VKLQYAFKLRYIKKKIAYGIDDKVSILSREISPHVQHSWAHQGYPVDIGSPFSCIVTGRDNFHFTSERNCNKYYVRADYRRRVKELYSGNGNFMPVK
jgi:hypothetical protein